jgi:hypothetical protein
MHANHSHHNQVVVERQTGYHQEGIYVQAQPTFEAQVIIGQA